jgi:nicotinamidase-related amidase
VSVTDVSFRAAALDHAWHIDEREYARQEERRGRRHAFTRLDPAYTALVVVDVVPFFFQDNPYLPAIVPRINKLAGALRARGGTVAWVVPGRDQARAAVQEFYGPAVAETYAASGGSGPVKDRLWPELEPDQRDTFVEKTASSAFFPGRCDLDSWLQVDQVETVIVVGTVTNVCVEATVRDAFTLGYRPILVADACAAGTDEVHNASLRTVYRSFGDVRPTSEVLDLIQG